MFVRQFDGVENILKEELYKNNLAPDCMGNFSHKEKNKDVFPAIRNNRIDFYSNGGKLFSYDKSRGFTTHRKYASVIMEGDIKGDYINLHDLKKCKLIKDFELGYDRIKELCGLYSGIESQGVSRLYNRFSHSKNKRKSKIVVLDIEISFKSEEKIQDRIDLLLFNTENKNLMFYEAKEFSNNEIRAQKGKKDPEVFKQIERYKKQLNSVTKVNEIIEQYQKYVEIINSLFPDNSPLPLPVAIDPDPRLLIFGFDNDQKNGRLQDNVKDLQALGIKVYSKGDIASVEIDQLWNSAK